MSSVVVPDGRVSKCHVWVGIRDGAATAIDQSSTNGTYLNQLGTRITAESLKPGDTLIISHDVTRLQYRES